MLRIVRQSCLFVLCFSTGAAAFADVPVVDYSADAGGRQSAAPVSSSSNNNYFQSVPEMPIGSSTTSNNVSNTESQVNQPVAQRLLRLENQVDNLNQQNSNAKLEDLQQKLQQAMGQLEEQAHQLEQLKTQLRDFYQDLDKRIDPTRSRAANIFPSISTVAAKSGAETAVPPVAAVPAEYPVKDVAETSAVRPGLLTDSAHLKEQQDYQTAIDLLPDRKYEASAKKLTMYINTYPKGAYIASAHYWLGEISFLQKKYTEATAEFKLLISKYPTSKKIPDAMLKMAFIDDMQGRHEQAVNGFKQVAKRFPNTAAGQLASKQL